MDMTHQDVTLSTGHSCADALAEVECRIAPHFTRSEVRERALAYLRGLLRPAERKNSWQLAEGLGDAPPYGCQHLLGRAEWDADVLRDGLQIYGKEQLGDEQAIMVIDESGFLKKGDASVGVARQDSGTAGRIENCQIGVFLTYVSQQGQTLLDRELYLPKAWTDDAGRCRRAGVPPARPFATNPALARQLLERVFAASVPACWSTDDSISGDNRHVRIWLEEQDRPPC